MPRYYFNVRDDDTTVDSEGMEFFDSHAAIAFAYKAAREIAVETAVRGRLVTDHRIEIVDADRQLIDTVTFGEAIGVD